MFRPYSLRSLAAWTAGSLAGNEAYYRVKGSSRRTTKSQKLSYPSSQYVNPKLVALFAEVNSLTDSIRNWQARGDGKMEIMPLVHLMAYREWFQTKKATIMAEVQNAENIQAISSHLDYMISGMLNIILEYLSKKEQQELLEMIKKRMISCTVNESSYRLADSNSGHFLIHGKKP